MSLEELRERRKKLKRSTDVTLHNMHSIADESIRVAEVAHNSHQILEDLDAEFESQTGLKSSLWLLTIRVSWLRMWRT